ncbi:MAG: ATP-binding protein [Candidatus Rifleibacteriota bacterium]
MQTNYDGSTSLQHRVVKFLEKNPDSGADVSEMSPERLIEELHIHQIELEMQNEELRLARENAERTQAKYIDLYDFAPVGYLTLKENLKIIEANLTATKLLGIERSQILHQPFTNFVDQEFQDILYFYLARVRKSEVHEACELKLKKDGKKPFYVLLESIATHCKESGRSEIRVSLSDIHQSKLDAIALKKSADHIMAQEEERSRISQVLHSEFGQALVALKLFIVGTSSDLPEENQQMRSVFDKIKVHLDKIINNARTLAHRLSPPSLKYVGLIPAINEMVESATTEKLQIRFFHKGDDQACFKKKDIIIYRIIQEALQNIVKHSEATRARVCIVLKKKGFTLSIKDNGKGFDPSLQPSAKGLGLALMKQQAALIRGLLSIKSDKGKGTLLKLRVPIKEKKAI